MSQPIRQQVRCVPHDAWYYPSEGCPTCAQKGSTRSQPTNPLDLDKAVTEIRGYFFESTLPSPPFTELNAMLNEILGLREEVTRLKASQNMIGHAPNAGALAPQAPPEPPKGRATGAHWNFCVRTVDASQPCNCLPPYAAEIMDPPEALPPESETAKPTGHRPCTCLGSCKGAEGLAPGWKCALVASPVASKRPPKTDPGYQEATIAQRGPKPGARDTVEGAAHADADSLIRTMIALTEVDESFLGLPSSKRAWLGAAYAYAGKRGDKSLCPDHPFACPSTPLPGTTEADDTRSQILDICWSAQIVSDPGKLAQGYLQIAKLLEPTPGKEADKP